VAQRYKRGTSNVRTISERHGFIFRKSL